MLPWKLPLQIHLRNTLENDLNCVEHRKLLPFISFGTFSLGYHLHMVLCKWFTRFFVCHLYKDEFQPWVLKNHFNSFLKCKISQESKPGFQLNVTRPGKKCLKEKKNNKVISPFSLFLMKGKEIKHNFLIHTGALQQKTETLNFPACALYSNTCNALCQNGVVSCKYWEIVSQPLSSSWGFSE